MRKLTKNFKKYYIGIFHETLTITMKVNTLNSLTARMSRQISVF